MIKNKEKFEKFRKGIKLIVLDVDGTLTDGKIYMGNSGELFKAFDIKDGCGIHDILPQYEIIPVIITARKSDIVMYRCKELQITECYQGVRNKLDKMREVAEKYGLSCNENDIYEEIAYVGDDIIDIECMLHCGIIACPNNAVEKVKEISDFISDYNGGEGAVRQFIELLAEGNYEYMLG